MSDAQGPGQQIGQQIGQRFSTRMTEGGSPGSPQLLVGHDTHPASKAAVLLAGDLAERLGAHLHVVHVIELADNPVDPDSPDWNAVEDTKLHELQRDAKQLLAGTHIDWTYHACSGDPVELLADIALEFEVLFVVLGSTERNLYRRLTEGGSVSQRLLREQGKAVLVVPAPHPEP